MLEKVKGFLNSLRNPLTYNLLTKKTDIVLTLLASSSCLSQQINMSRIRAVYRLCEKIDRIH
jgi:hypothetical protein